MTIDSTEWIKPALHGDVASVALDASIGLRRVHLILFEISKKLEIDISEDLEKLYVAAEDLDKSFDRLAGYQK